MLATRTPLRVSFFGGGTDYPEYFSRHPGCVVGMAINRYIYITAIELAEFIDYRYRLSYSRLERVNSVNELEHPVVRSVLQHYEVSSALDISVMADLPASSGLGSSSSFTVGLINLICALKSNSPTRLDLAKAAFHVERELLQERVGVQDPLHAAFGGLNRFDFVDGRTHIAPVQMNTQCLEYFISSLVLVYTGKTRYASEVLKEQLKATRESNIDRELGHLLTLAKQAVDVLETSDPERLLTEFGAMMHDGWETKRNLTPSISSPEIDELYRSARESGALGGKLCGAGGGGFLLMVVPPESRKTFDVKMKAQSLIPVRMDTQGSSLIGV